MFFKKLMLKLFQMIVAKGKIYGNTKKCFNNRFPILVDGLELQEDEKLYMMFSYVQGTRKG